MRVCRSPIFVAVSLYVRVAELSVKLPSGIRTGTQGLCCAADARCDPTFLHFGVEATRRVKISRGDVEKSKLHGPDMFALLPHELHSLAHMGNTCSRSPCSVMNALTLATASG